MAKLTSVAREQVFAYLAGKALFVGLLPKVAERKSAQFEQKNGELRMVGELVWPNSTKLSWKLAGVSVEDSAGNVLVADASLPETLIEPGNRFALTEFVVRL